MEPRAVVVPPGQGHRIGNVEFLARTADTPRFTFGIIEIAAGRMLEAHVHDSEDDAFYILDGEMTFVIGEEVAAPAGHVRPRAAGHRARLPQRRRRAGADAQHPRAGGLRPPDRPVRLVRVLAGRGRRATPRRAR